MKLLLNAHFIQINFNKGSYCYLDKYLGLKKNDYFGPYIKALVLDKAANNSASKVADYINNLRFNLKNTKNKK